MDVGTLIISFGEGVGPRPRPPRFIGEEPNGKGRRGAGKRRGGVKRDGQKDVPPQGAAIDAPHFIGENGPGKHGMTGRE